MADNDIDKNSIMFISLVTSLGSQAFAQLGKVKDPSTNNIERNLDAASLSIDMLDMLKERTQGNLSEQETSLLEKTLSDLKLNIVQESKYESHNNKKDKSE